MKKLNVLEWGGALIDLLGFGPFSEGYLPMYSASWAYDDV